MEFARKCISKKEIDLLSPFDGNFNFQQLEETIENISIFFGFFYFFMIY
jgi:hypothetical protein